MPTTATSGNTFLASFVNNILTPLYQIALGISLAYFLFGVAMFIFKMKNNPNEIEKGRNHLLYGTLGLFIMFTIGAIFNVFNTVFGNMFN